MIIDTLPPFRLDLTANVLRRLSTNVVDVLTPDGIYARAFDDGTILEVRGGAADSLEARFVGSRRSPSALVRRMLGTDRDLRPFYRAVRAIPWLAALARRMRGVKPPSYPTLWEAIVNAVVFQQVSLAAASSILGRLIVKLSHPVAHHGLTLFPFPGPSAFIATPAEQLRACGLSASKARTLHELGAAIAGGALDEQALGALPTTEVVERLVSLRGIGAWTASVVALRGLGRLDVFPLGDSGIGRSLPALARGDSTELGDVLTILGEQRGMLYYHVLLGRLEAAGALGKTRRKQSQ
ncbi:MAG TPA: base excision DNA repair protein [Candidatus Binatia bacterium]|nr:base excision DNA repair protein [Candidatus Binatia bacterium]